MGANEFAEMSGQKPVEGEQDQDRKKTQLASDEEVGDGGPRFSVCGPEHRSEKKEQQAKLRGKESAAQSKGDMFGLVQALTVVLDELQQASQLLLALLLCSPQRSMQA